MDELQKQVAETGHAMQELAADVSHAAKQTDPRQLSKSLGVIYEGLASLRSLVAMQRHKADHLAAEDA